MATIEWWKILLIMAVIVALILVPILSWYLHKRYSRKKTAVPPLMYISALSTARTADDTTVVTNPSHPSYLPPSYEDICNGVYNTGYSSSSSLALSPDGLPNYDSVASQRSSVVLSTFYNDSPAASRPMSTVDVSDSESHDSLPPPSSVTLANDTDIDTNRGGRPHVFEA